MERKEVGVEMKGNACRPVSTSYKLHPVKCN